MFKYLLKPYFSLHKEKYSVTRKIEFLFIAYVICIFATILVMQVTNSMDYILTKIFHQQPFYQLAIGEDAKKTDAVQQRFLIFVLVAPLCEELIFRLTLDLKKRSFAIATFIITATVFHKFLYITDWRIVKLLIDFSLAAVLAITVYYYMPGSILQKFKGKKFNVYFYGSAILFSLLHISNYFFGQITSLFFLPLLVLPHFISALFLGTIRMRYGFWWAVWLHVLFNLPVALMN